MYIYIYWLVTSWLIVFWPNSVRIETFGMCVRFIFRWVSTVFVQVVHEKQVDEDRQGLDSSGVRWMQDVTWKGMFALV